jgi:hypothetical protein
LDSHVDGARTEYRTALRLYKRAGDHAKVLRVAELLRSLEVDAFAVAEPRRSR